MNDHGHSERRRFLRESRTEDLPWSPLQAILVAVALVATLSLT